MTSSGNDSSTDNSIKGDGTKIEIFKNLVNGAINGYIVEGKNMTGFAKKSLKVGTDCEYSFVVSKQKPKASNITSPNPNPFAGCVNGSINGYIVEEKNMAGIAKKSLKVGTDCEYSFVVPEQKSEASNITSPNPNPFVGCGSRYVGTLYSIYLNPKNRFNLTAGADKEVRNRNNE